MIKKRDNLPLYLSAAAIFLFYVWFTRLIIKTDDGHFLGILSEEGFVLADWLKERYATVSGRTVSEFLMMSFLKINPIFWKLFSSAAFAFLLWFISKICSAFAGGFSQKQRNVFCACIPFLVFSGAANPGAFWFSGSFTYLLPFTAFAAVISPLAFDLLGVDYKKAELLILGAAAAPLACSQEQTTALTLAFYVVLTAALAVKKRVKPYHFISLPLCAASAFFLFASPGMRGRMAMETGGFERFAQMSFCEKILCGFTNYFGYSIFMSAAVMGIFIAAAVLALCEAGGKKMKIFASFVFFFWIFTVVIWNIIFIFVSRKTPDSAFEAMFKKGGLSPFGIVTAALCFALLSAIAVLLILLARKTQAGFAALLCFAAAVCSGVVMGFSPSVYASGQRVFFFSDMLLLFGGAALMSCVSSSAKSRFIYNFSVIAAAVVFGLKCINYAFLEVPVMG